MNQLFRYCLATAAARTGVLVYGAVLMSTHEHLVLEDPHGRLPEFLQYFHRLVALGTKVLRRWEGAVWDHEPTSVVELRTPQAVVEALAYVMANPTAAGLVPRAKDWPGITTRPSDLGVATWSVQRPTEYFAQNDARWPASIELRLQMPRAARELGVSDDELRELVAHRLDELERAARSRAREGGMRFLGADRCAKLDPYRRATSWEPNRERNPTFAVGWGNHDARKEAVARLRAFRAAYREAFDRWRAGVRDVVFPAGTWLMRHRHGARVDAPLTAAA